jgi:hypothetical protein
MNPAELSILDQISAQLRAEDASLAARLAAGPRFTPRYRLCLGLVATVGVGLTLLFSANLVFGVAGYLILVVAGTITLRRRPLVPVEASPLEMFHRFTGELFRSTGASVHSQPD